MPTTKPTAMIASLKFLLSSLLSLSLAAGCASADKPTELALLPPPEAAKSPSSEMELKVVPSTAASAKAKAGLPLAETQVGDLKNETIPAAALAPLKSDPTNDQSQALPAESAQEIKPHSKAVADSAAHSAALSAVPSAAKQEHKQPHHAKAVGIEPTKALKWLKNGNQRFLKKNFRKDGQSRLDVARLNLGQKPHTIVLSCSDSRVPPEIVFDQKLGEIFVVRTAGETLDSSGIASIEYAVAHLGARLILVMGHTSCGAVKAAIGTLNGSDAGSEHLNKLVSDIHPRLKAAGLGTDASGNLSKESWANAKGVAKDLVARSALLADAVKSGDLQITSSLYNLDSGSVDFE